MQVTERIADRREELTPGERRVAEIVLADPQAVAFGTVASVAERAGVSGPTVLRMAARCGYPGFAALQAAVQEELASRLRPAAERIHQRPAPDPLARALEVELENVHATLSGVDPDTFERAIETLADTDHHVAVVSGEATIGVAASLTDQLTMLRGGVELFEGSEVRIARRLATLIPTDTLVAIDVRRYERWLLDTVGRSHAHIVAVTDSLLSPLAEAADLVFVVDAGGAGPFDSHVGTLALCNALAAGVSADLRTTATRRLERIERAWRDAGSLVEG